MLQIKQHVRDNLIAGLVFPHYSAHASVMQATPSAYGMTNLHRHSVNLSINMRRLYGIYESIEVGSILVMGFRIAALGSRLRIEG